METYERLSGSAAVIMYKIAYDSGKEQEVDLRQKEVKLVTSHVANTPRSERKLSRVEARGADDGPTRSRHGHHHRSEPERSTLSGGKGAAFSWCRYKKPAIGPAIDNKMSGLTRASGMSTRHLVAKYASTE